MGGSGGAGRSGTALGALGSVAGLEAVFSIQRIPGRSERLLVRRTLNRGKEPVGLGAIGFYIQDEVPMIYYLGIFHMRIRVTQTLPS